MKDWRKIGRELYERLKPTPASTYRVPKRPLTQEEELGSALLQSARGNPARLIAYLRSDMPLPLDSNSREHLAKHLDVKKRRGPRPNKAVRQVANWALLIYEEWKRANQKAGISNRGLGDAMKDASCEYALKILEHDEVNPDAARELMERPKHRRVSP